ncbi:hypothetical protein V496_05287 [Pseudogymnoascus sp. VKM F-4515 (FW-2607)]|nr:hypothetical protein V496_05287 [Pseudogymnoascus sp. VKM F-4515 (FW-2607)]
MSSVGKGKSPELAAPPATPTPVAATVATRQVKVQMLEPYSGERHKLKAFLLKCDLYIGFNTYTLAGEADQVLWAVALLRGAAFDWIEFFVNEYLEKKGPEGQLYTNMAVTTREIFRTWKGFKANITKVFGDLDAERTAERHLMKIQQKGSVTSYTAEFQQWQGRTDWNDDALRARYYDGLKDSIKDEIARGVRPDDLEKLILTATLIDNRHYERRLEKGGQKPTWIQKKPKQRNYWPQPMELDATFKQGGRPRNLNKERQLKERLCFNCNKPGHMARECKQPKKGNGGRKFGKQLNATWQGRDNTLEEESSEEDSDTESLTPSERKTFDDLAPKHTMNDRCADLVHTMTKFAHKKIKEAKGEPKAERNIPIIRSVYKTALGKLPRQVLAEDRQDDLWTYYN